MTNVVDLDSKRQKENEHACSHCVLKNKWISELVNELMEAVANHDGNILEEVLEDIANEYFEVSYTEGKKAAYEDLAGYATYSIEQEDEIDQ